MSFKIALLVFTAFIGAQAQSASLVSCSSNRTDAFCGNVTSFTAPSCCASVFNVTRNSSGSVLSNTTNFYCLPIGYATGSKVPNYLVEAYKNPSNGNTVNIQAYCANTNLTESLCQGGNDVGCGGDFCCSSRRLNTSITTPTSSSGTLDLANICIPKSQNVSWRISGSNVTFGLTGGCIAADVVEEETSFAFISQISFALFTTVIGLAFF